jgi:hypothetical protein
VFQNLRAEGVRRADVARQLEIPVDELNKMTFGLVLTDLPGRGVTSAQSEPAIKLQAVH